ncbi:MAG: hypothetical protein KGZ25_13480, partial [Planctomycetes bacterium]|nr:hypothetical protein [Planctomycetota bacterium]
MRKVVSCLLVAALLIVSASFAGAASAEDGSSVSTIEAQGIKKVVKTEKRAISDDRIEVTTTVGEKVTGHLTLESNQLDGVIVVNPDKDGTERYVIASSEPFKEDNLQGYRGEIKNSDLCYEAF